MKTLPKLFLLATLLMSAVAGTVSLTPQEMIAAGCTQNPDGTMHCPISTRAVQMHAMKRANIALPPSQKPAINPNTGNTP